MWNKFSGPQNKYIGFSHIVSSRVCRFPGPDGEKNSASPVTNLKCCIYGCSGGEEGWGDSSHHRSIDLTARDRLVMNQKPNGRLGIEQNLDLRIVNCCK